MKLHFPWAEVEKLLAEVAANTAENNVAETTANTLFLSWRQGVFLWETTIVYAEEADPTKVDFDAWWQIRCKVFREHETRRTITLGDVDALRKTSPTHLVVDVSRRKLAVSVITKSP